MRARAKVSCIQLVAANHYHLGEKFNGMPLTEGRSARFACADGQAVRENTLLYADGVNDLVVHVRKALILMNSRGYY